MNYYEVLLADSHFRGGAPLTYSWAGVLPKLSVVVVPLKNRLATGFVMNQVPKPSFSVKPIKNLQSDQPLPFHCIELAEWIADYYGSSLGEALKQFGPSSKAAPRDKGEVSVYIPDQANLSLDSKLTAEQMAALEKINTHPSTTVLLHGQTGSGKTRVYLELAQKTIESGRSVIILTPEISLTTQLQLATEKKLSAPVFVIHSELTPASRKKIWLSILQATEPIVVIGPRSALFSPINNLGLVIVDEAHEPAYKQEQAPRYNATRVASQLGLLTSSRVVLGSATPSITDYYVANQRQAVVSMKLQALSGKPADARIKVVDLRDRANFKRHPYLSDMLIDDINTTLSNGAQALLYFNRRGSARLIMCSQCGWQLVCPNCDVPLVYHSDDHLARCHICGFRKNPPAACPECGNSDVIYKSIGTKALVGMVEKLFPHAKIQRFDSDSIDGERLNENYAQLHRGDTDILIGTQLLAKGLDLPRLGLVGIISAETSLTLPDYASEERTFQLLYQVIGRVGRGHRAGTVVIQSYEPESMVIKTASERDYDGFYKNLAKERQTYRFPPFAYLLKLVCKRATLDGVQKATENLKKQLLEQGLPVEIIGPSPSFWARRGRYYYWQLVIKSKDRSHLVALAALAPAGWTIDLDPMDLL